jgi:hypothetical protein
MRDDLRSENLLAKRARQGVPLIMRNTIRPARKPKPIHSRGVIQRREAVGILKRKITGVEYNFGANRRTWRPPQIGKIMRTA